MLRSVADLVFDQVQIGIQAFRSFCYFKEMQNLATGRFQKSGNKIQERGFPASRTADNSPNVSFFYGYTYILKDSVLSKALANSSQFNEFQTIHTFFLTE